jgi:PAS domain S-box-containing protein
MKPVLDTHSLYDIYKSLFDLNRDACYALDVEGNFLLFNHAAVKVTGYTVEEALQMSFLPLIDEGQLEKTIQHFYQSLKGKQNSFETAIIHKLGNRVDLNVVALPYYIGKQLCGVVGIAKDITNQKKLEILLNGENKILEMIAREATFSEILESIVYMIEEISNGGVCSILMADENEKRLTNICSPNLPIKLRELVKEIPIRAFAGSCGTPVI